MSYIAVRVKPLKKWSDVANSTRHGRREDQARHVDRLRSHLNRHWAVTGSLEFEAIPEPADIAQAFNFTAELAGANWRKGAIVGTEMLFIASPEFFAHADHEGRPIRGTTDLEKAYRWADACLAAAHKRYPGQIAAARLDLDEKTPHLSIFMLPTYEKAYEGETRVSKRQRTPRKAISHNQTFGTPEKLSELQDWAAGEMRAAGFGNLQRGRRKGTKGPDHLTPAEGRRRIEEAERVAEKIVAKAEARAAKIIQTAEAAEPEPKLVAELRAENRRLTELVSGFSALLDSIRATLRRLFSKEDNDRVTTAIRSDWAKNPANPEFKAEDNADRQLAGGPRPQ